MKIFVQHFSGGIKYWLVKSGDKLSLDTDKKKAVDILKSESPSVARKLAAAIGDIKKLDGFSVYGEDSVSPKRKLRDNPRPKAKGASASAKKKKAASKPSKPQKKASKPSPAKKPKRCKK